MIIYFTIKDIEQSYWTTNDSLKLLIISKSLEVSNIVELL